METVDGYRRKAAEMLTQAARAMSPTKRRICLEMAAAWEKLASGAAEFARKTTLEQRLELGMRRASALAEYDVLDTPPDAEFDAIALEAAAVCGAPIAVVNFVGDDRQYFKAEVGLGVRSTPFESSFCAEALLADDLVIVPDATLDPRFACNPLVQGEPHLRFYAGVLLKPDNKLALGTVCVLDYAPRPSGLTQEQVATLEQLGRRATTLLEQRRAAGSTPSA